MAASTLVLVVFAAMRPDTVDAGHFTNWIHPRAPFAGIWNYNGNANPASHPAPYTHVYSHAHSAASTADSTQLQVPTIPFTPRQGAAVATFADRAWKTRMFGMERDRSPLPRTPDAG